MRSFRLSMVIAIACGFLVAFLAGLPSRWLLTYDLGVWGQFVFGLSGFISCLALRVGTKKRTPAGKFVPEVLN